MTNFGRLTLKLAAFIPFGKENAISRDVLACSLELSDRKMREAIEQARADGLMIVNLGDGNGYYQTDNLDEIEAQYRKDTARAMSVLKRRKPMRELLKAAGRSV